MTSYTDMQNEHVRLAILRGLEDAPGYTSNVSLLKVLLQSVGLPSTRENTAQQCEWLQAEGLVELQRPAGFLVVIATERGIEVAQGMARHQGVHRRRPGS